MRESPEGSKECKGCGRSEVQAQMISRAKAVSEVREVWSSTRADVVIGSEAALTSTRADVVIGAVEELVQKQ